MILDADFKVRRGNFELTLDIDVNEGEVVALLGPNGSGKTTALHVLAGLLPIDVGHVTLNGLIIDDARDGIFTSPEQRHASLVFQDHLLFPHLDARSNVAFPMRAKGVKRLEAQHVADTWLQRFGLSDLAKQRPRQLSGGQAQRVALARALAAEPELLLLDEPLAALDAGTRVAVRRELRTILSDFRGATIIVTHDPLDAIALASKIIVLEDGRAVQEGSISDLTARPRSGFVAELVGLNLFAGTAGNGSIAIGNSSTTKATAASIATVETIDGDVFAMIHPRAIALHRDEPGGSPRNRWHNTIESFDLLGDRVRVRTTGELDLVAEITTVSMTELDLHQGDRVWLSVKATEVSVYPR